MNSQEGSYGVGDLGLCLLPDFTFSLDLHCWWQLEVKAHRAKAYLYGHHCNRDDAIYISVGVPVAVLHPHFLPLLPWGCYCQHLSAVKCHWWVGLQGTQSLIFFYCRLFPVGQFLPLHWSQWDFSSLTHNRIRPSIFRGRVATQQLQSTESWDEWVLLSSYSENYCISRQFCCFPCVVERTGAWKTSLCSEICLFLFISCLEKKNPLFVRTSSSAQQPGSHKSKWSFQVMNKGKNKNRCIRESERRVPRGRRTKIYKKGEKTTQRPVGFLS